MNTSCGQNVTKVTSSDTNTDTTGSFKCVFADGPLNTSVSASATDSDNDEGQTATQDVTIANVAPAANGQSVSTDEDMAKTITLTGTDPGNDDLTFSITDPPDNGTLGSIGQVSCTGTAPRTCSADVTYTPDNNSSGPDSFEFEADDGAGSDAATVSISVAALNDAPTVTTQSGSASYTEGGAAVAVSPGLNVSDPDNANLVSATVSITTGFRTGDTLSFTGDPQITGTYDSGTGVLTFSGSDTKADYEAVLRSVEYSSTSNTPGASRTVSFRGNDGTDDSNTATRDVSITEVNSAPVVTTSGGITSFTENSPPVAVDDQITATDADSTNLTGATVSITTNFASGQDELLFADTAQIDGTYENSTGVLTLVGDASVADYQAALRSVRYDNTSNTPNTNQRTVSFQVDDGSSVDNLSNTATKDVSVAAANDAPELDLNGGGAGTGHSATFNEGGPALSIVESAAVTDVDDTSIDSATVTITNLQDGAAESLDADVGATGITKSYDSSTGVLTLTTSTSKADYQQVLRTVTYNNTSQNPGTTDRNVTFVVNDGEDDSNTATSTVTANPVNDAPVLTTTAGPLAYTENDAATAVDDNITLTDVDDTSITGATVQITNNYVEGQDILSFATANGISGSFDAPSGMLTHASGTKTVAEYETALRNVKYNNTNENPSTDKRTVTFRADDGSSASDPATRDIDVTAGNDAPVNTVPSGSLYTGEGEDLAITGISTSDVDAGTGEVNVTLSVTGGANNGTLSLNTGTDENTTDDNIVVITGTVDEVNAILDDGLTYINSNSGDYTLTVVTDDQGNAGSGGAKTDTDTVGITVDAAPEVTTTTPANAATNVALDGNFTINFSESVNASASSFEPKCPATGTARTFTITGNGTNTITLNPNSDLPGATNCTVLVKANGIADTDLNDPPNNMAADHTFTFTTAPKAIADDYKDTFTVVGNVRFDSATRAPSLSVLDNDEKDGSTVVTAFDATSAQGGNVTVRSNGTFEYNPPAGYEGLDTFTYTVTGGSTATVTLRVGGMIWFVDENATTSGDGRLSSPFDTLSAFNAVNNGAGNNPAADDNVFLYESTNNYTGPVTLLNNQRLIGQDATSSLATITSLNRPSGSAGFPTMSTVNATKTTITTTAASTNGVNVASGNTLRGFTVGDTTGSDINGSNFGTLRVTDLSLTGSGRALNLTTGTLAGGGFDTITSTSGTNNILLNNVQTSGTANLGNGALSGATQESVKISGQNGSFTYSGTIANTTTGTLAASITGKTGGTVTLSGKINDATAGKGISVSNNSAGTITFSGDSKKFAGSSGTLVDLSFPNASTATVEFTNGGLNVAGTSSAAGFKAAGVDGNDGTVKVQGSNNVVSTASGRALDAQQVNIGAPAASEGGLNFKSISANGATNGIVLNNTGASGGLTVTGNGGMCISAATCTGGAIQNTTGDGVSLTSTRGVSLDRMMIQNNAANGIRGTSVTNFTLANSTLLDNASDPPGGANDEANIRFDGLLGTASISGSDISGADEDQVRIFNNSGTLGSLTVQNNNIHDTATAGLGNQAINLEASGSADVTSTFQGGTYDKNYAGDIKATTNGFASMDTTVSGITAGNNGNGGVSVETSHNSSGDYDFDITGNTITGNAVPNSSSGILVNKGIDGTGTQSGTVSGNTVDLNNSQVGPGIFVASNGTGGTLTVDINNNRVREVSNYGIQAIARQGNSTLNATIRNNPEISTSGSAPLNAIDVQAGASSTTDTVTVCADVAGNTASTTGGSGVFAITFVQLRLSHLRIEGYTGAANNEGAIETFLASQNTVSSGHSAPHVDMEFVGTPQDTTGISSCPMP